MISKACCAVCFVYITLTLAFAYVEGKENVYFTFCRLTDMQILHALRNQELKTRSGVREIFL